MKVLFIGAGSIGKRHIRDFFNECEYHGIIPEIQVLRRKVGDLGELNKYVSKQITELVDSDYDITFITNPTNLHYEVLSSLVNRTKFYFIEKPIFEKTTYDISSLGINDFNSYVAAPMRHTSLYKKIKNIVQKNKVFSARVMCSSYLPEWRKNVDYRTVYSAKKDMGGGVGLDLIHEIDYVYDLFGPPESVFAASGKFSDLDITSNDLSVYILKYKSMLCEIHLDYFGRRSVRTCELFTKEGSYVADFFKEILYVPDGSTIDCHVKSNEEFINEMHHFYNFINGKEQSLNPPSLALKTLDIAIKGDY